MKIGALAKLTSLSVQTIRYYEQEGLLSTVSRTEGNYRFYDEAASHDLFFIKQCRNLGLTLEEIRQLIGYSSTPNETCNSINTIIDSHIQQVDVRLAELQELRRQLGELRTKCDAQQAVKDCGIMKELLEH
ncbi:Cd(II)/Pb(II)-responsive transcriptional regulator [Cellvibrio sp.]